MKVDPADLLVPGPWEHQFVSANGSRFHVATMGDDDDPLVLLLHAFPQHWYAWREQLPRIAAAGYRVAAMDLRGYGSSDKPPRGHDLRSLVADVSGVIRSLGASEAVVVGQGYGGQVAWAMPALAPAVTRAIALIASPHPRVLRRRGLLRSPRTMGGEAVSALAFVQLPTAPERKLRRDWVAQMARTWGAPGWEPDPVATQLYATAMRQPAAAHHVLEQLRWQVRSSRRRAGRSVLTALARPVSVPVLSLHGAADPVFPPSSRTWDAEFVAGPYREVIFPGVGHWVAEEAPDATTEELLAFLATLPPLS